MSQISEMSYELIHQLPECGTFSIPEHDEQDSSEEQPPWISDDSDTDRKDGSASQSSADDREHPFLDLDAQRMQVEYEKQQQLAEYCARMSAEQQLTCEEQMAALKMVMHEAHRLQRAKEQLPTADCDTQWKHIGSSAVRDCYVEGHTFVQRRLSCMCIFNPNGGVKQYIDSDLDRLKRQANQQAILNTLRLQSARGDENLFLKTNVTEEIEIPLESASFW